MLTLRGMVGVKTNPAFSQRLTMADRALILSADHYSITDQKTGEVNQLYQVWYVNDYRQNSDRELGFKPIKMLMESSAFEELRKEELPALFDLDLRSRPGKANSAALTVVGFKFVSRPEIFNVLPKDAKGLPKAA